VFKPLTSKETVQNAKQYPPKRQPPVLRTNQLRDLNFANYLKHRTGLSHKRVTGLTHHCWLLVAGYWFLKLRTV
jgi:hypothetical protein